MKNNYLEILLLSDNSIETVGGEQESTKIIMENLKNDYNIGIIQPGRLKKNSKNIKYFYLTEQTRIKHLIKNPFAFLKYVNNVKNIIKLNKPKIIHTQAQISFFIVSLLKRFGQIPAETKLIHTERGLYTKYNVFFRNIFFFFMKNLDILVTTTEFNLVIWKDAIKNRDIKLKYKLIPNTAGEIFETYDSKLNTTSEERITIGFSGRYTEWKNWPLAVEISKKINQILGDKVLIKMAVGCLDSNSEKKTLEMFNELSTEMGGRFEGKINITLSEMNIFYYNIDVFILTSKHNTESFGRTLVEAMSRMTAVLTTDAGGAVEVVGNRDRVLDTADEFVNTIVELFDNPQKLDLEKENNIRRVKYNYSLNHNISEHKKMYSEILNY